MAQGAQAICWIRPPVPISQFTRCRLLVAVAIGSETGSDRLDDGLHLRRQPAVAGGELLALALQVQVKLDGACAPGVDGAIEHGGADAVVGPTDRAAASGAQGLDGGQVAFVRRRGVAGDAVQQGQLGAAGVMRGGDGVLDLGQRGHTGGEDQRLAGAGAGADEVVPEQLVGGDLVEVDVGLELGDGVQVKRCAGELDALLVAALGELGQEGQWQLPVLALSVGLALGQDLGREELVNLEELKLDRVAADARGGVDEVETAREVAVVVAGDFGDELGQGLSTSGLEFAGPKIT